MGPQRKDKVSDEVQIAVSSYVYRLRIAQALLEEHNRTVLQSQATTYVADLVVDLLKAGENAEAFVRSLQERSPSEDGLGS